MEPDRVSNLGSLTYESGALPTALRGPARGAEADVARWGRGNLCSQVNMEASIAGCLQLMHLAECVSVARKSRIYHRSPFQTEKYQPESKRGLPSFGIIRFSYICT